MLRDSENGKCGAGPLDENGNPPADCSMYDQLYTIYQGDISEYESNGILSERLQAWPWELGAPVVDGDGNPDNYNLEGGDRPAISGHQSIWWVMNDRGNVHESTKVPPLGVEIQATAFAALSDSQESVNNATLYKYLITYEGTEPVENAYFGIFSDPDLGYFGDDYNGSDSALGLAFVYNGDNDDEGDGGYGTPPPAVGYTFLQGPLVDQDGLDNNGDGDIDEPGEQLPMSSFVAFDNGSFLTVGPDSGPDYYNHLKGLFRGGGPIFYGGGGYDGVTDRITTFMFSGDPATGEGWTELNPGLDGSIPPRGPSDKRFSASVGPFSMQPGEQQEIAFAVVWAQGEDNLDSVTELKKAAVEIQELYASGFNVPLPAQAPLEPVQLLAPSDGISDQPINPILFWENPLNFTQFEIEYSESPSFDTSIREEIAKENQWTIQSLLPNTTYYWRVRILEAGFPGPWSTAWQFSTSSEPIQRGVPPIAGFMTVQNGAGAINPPEMAAFAFNNSGFPILEGSLTPEGSYPNPDRPTPGVQQSTSEATWGIHTGGPNRVFYEDDNGQSFIERSLRRGWQPVGVDDYEWRFPQYCFDAIDGTVDDGDCLAFRFFSDNVIVEVPFELWNVGNVDDPEDDFRMIPIICSQACGAGSADPNSFEIGGDHSVSGGDDDPSTPWVYWFNPAANKASRGEAGYEQFFSSSATNDDLGDEVFSRMVLVQLNGGASAPYDVELPEPGTIFRIAIDPFPVPVISAPLDGAATDVTNTSLVWQGSAAPFQVQIATDSTFESIIVDSLNIQSPYFQVANLPEGQQFYWRVRVSDGASNPASDWSRISRFSPMSISVSNEPDLAPIPDLYKLAVNYPNPFSGITHIRYALPESTPVQLDVFDLLGRRVKTLVSSEQQSGWHDVEFDGSSLPAGMYLYRLETDTFIDVKTMVIVR